MAGEALQEQGVGGTAVEEVGPADAVTHYREALRIKPDYDAAREMLRLALDPDKR